MGRDRSWWGGQVPWGHLTYGSDKLIKVELYDPKSGIVVLRRFLTPGEFDKLKEEHRAGKWPNLEWRLA